MGLKFLPIASFFLFVSMASAEMYHHLLSPEKDDISVYEWDLETDVPFDELLISWNAARPVTGNYSIHVSVDQSPWLLYAHWAGDHQKGFQSSEESSVRVYQDAVEVLNGQKVTHFRVRVMAEEGASLDDFEALHVCASDMTQIESKPFSGNASSVALPVEGLSQMALADERRDRFCSPVSTAAVVRYLRDPSLDPVAFAEHVWDGGFDIFGNWVFNTAQAWAELGTGFSCWVERLSGFDDIYACLSEGMPVVISVRSPLPGSAKFYKSGHLIVIKGFDAETREVLCMDPAFATDGETDVRYALDDLLEAWERRKWVAYIFKRIT